MLTHYDVQKMDNDTLLEEFADRAQEFTLKDADDPGPNLVIRREYSMLKMEILGRMHERG